jgi:limonene-1,2-epoxide hydrolase
VSQEPGAVVRAFVAEFDVEHPDIERLVSYFTEDAVYHNMPGQPARGRAAIRAALGYTQRLSSAGWEIVHQATAGGIVFNERLDRFKVGERTVELPVCGVFELQDGQIAAWRDYFDMAAFQRMIAPNPE